MRFFNHDIDSRNLCFFLLIIFLIEVIVDVGLNKTSIILGPHDARVRIKALGICGSDVHHFKVTSPLIIFYFHNNREYLFAFSP